MSYRVEPILDRSFVGSMKRTSSQFTTTWGDTESLLLAEVGHLRGRNLLIRVDMTADQFRLDGTLRANAKAMSNGVVVEFETEKHGDLKYELDRYNGLPWRPRMAQLWQHNVRAIALSLKALRDVDRWGATQGKQYTGFKAIGGGIGLPASGMTSEAAVDFMVGLDIGYGEESWERVTKLARRYCHPDHHFGDRTLWNEMEKAIDTLSRSKQINS